VVPFHINIKEFGAMVNILPINVKVRGPNPNYYNLFKVVLTR
jgi:hypothetical protein